MRPPLTAPIYLNFMITIAICGDQAENQLGRDHWNSPAGKAVRKWLCDEGLVRHLTNEGDWDHWFYEATERGRAWIEHCCATPLPVSKTEWSRG